MLFTETSADGKRVIIHDITFSSNHPQGRDKNAQPSPDIVDPFGMCFCWALLSELTQKSDSPAPIVVSSMVNQVQARVRARGNINGILATHMVDGNILLPREPIRFSREPCV